MVAIKERFGSQVVEQFKRGEKWIKVKKDNDDRAESFAVDENGTLWHMRFGDYLTENNESIVGWIPSRTSYNQIEQSLDEWSGSEAIDPEHPELLEYFNELMDEVNHHDS